MALLINNDVSRRLLSTADAVEVLEDAFIQEGNGNAAFQQRTDFYAPDTDVSWDADHYRWGSMLGAIRDPPRLALRYKSDMITLGATEDKNSVARGKYQGFVLLFDTSNGELIGMLNDGHLQHARVGATAGLACKYLAVEDATSVGMLGSGGMARTYAEAFNAVRDLEHMKVYSPTKAHRETYASEMSDELGIDITPVETPREAVRNVDIAATATNANETIYDADWLEDGQFFVNVQWQEIDAEAVSDSADRTIATQTRPLHGYDIGSEAERERMFDDIMKGSYERFGFVGERAESVSHLNVVDNEDVATDDRPTISDVLTGKTSGRQDDDETIFYENYSSGIQFAAVGNLVWERATENNLGTEVPIEWFLQDIRD